MSKKKKLRSLAPINKTLLINSSFVALLSLLLLIFVNQNVHVVEYYGSSNAVLGKDDPSGGGDKGNEQKIEVKHEEIKDFRPETTRTEQKPDKKFPDSALKNTKITPGTFKRDEIESEDGASKSGIIPPKLKTEIHIVTHNDKNGIGDKNTAKVEFQKDGLKVHYEFKNGQLEVKAEGLDGEEATKEEVEKLQEDLKNTPLKAASTEDGSVAIVNDKVAALSKFPLKINANTNQIEITTPDGVKSVAVLPDQAVINMIASNILQSVNATSIASSSSSAVQSVELSSENGKAIYKIKGEKTERVFGLFPVKTNVTAVVDANSGKLINRERSILAEIAAFLSP